MAIESGGENNNETTKGSGENSVNTANTNTEVGAMSSTSAKPRPYLLDLHLMDESLLLVFLCLRLVRHIFLHLMGSFKSFTQSIFSFRSIVQVRSILYQSSSYFTA